MTVWQRLRLWETSNGDAESPRRMKSRPDLRIAALGSGSDYTVFTDHLGVASLDLGFGGEDAGGQYHSIYDDFYFYTHFDDTDFSYGRALAQTAGIDGDAAGGRAYIAVQVHQLCRHDSYLYNGDQGT